MNFGLIIIGDEILSGKRQDKHFPKVVEMLNERGLSLAWAQYLGDDRPRLTQVLARSFGSGDVVFCCGGIGATPDDHTRQAAAAALGVPLELHAEARQLITLRTAEMAAEGKANPDMDTPENRQRLKMGEFPVGAAIVPNPVNRIPGFSIAQHFFVPGFPVMAAPMIAWALDTHFAQYFHRDPQAERGFFAYEIPESAVTPVLEAVEREFPGIRTFSLPSVGAQGERRQIELGVKGPLLELDAAYERLEQGIAALGAEIGPAMPRP